MRLSANLADRLVSEARAVFGEDAELWLFGSRADDTARGGDIDLYIETDLEEGLLDRRLEYLNRLFRVLGDRRVDLVIHSRHRPFLPIHRIARKTGVTLFGSARAEFGSKESGKMNESQE
jgi:predicted nucleotidyltransferase